jgi:hypothetical protein
MSGHEKIAADYFSLFEMHFTQRSDPDRLQKIHRRYPDEPTTNAASRIV